MLWDQGVSVAGDRGEQLRLSGHLGQELGACGGRLGCESSHFLSQASPPPHPLGWLGSSLSHWPESSQAGEGRWPDEWLKQLLPQDTRGLNSITFLSGRREKHQAGGNSWRPGAGRGGNIAILETICVKGESDLCALI